MNTEKQSENTFSEQTKRLEQQISFIREMDKEKFIGRQTYLSDGKRKENDAEHAWHLALMTFLLSEYANEPIDVLKTMVMVLFHDVLKLMPVIHMLMMKTERRPRPKESRRQPKGCMVFCRKIREQS